MLRLMLKARSCTLSEKILNYETTVLLVKPDGARHKVVDQLLGRIYGKGLTVGRVPHDPLRGTATVCMCECDVRRRYKHLVGKPFFKETVRYLTENKMFAWQVCGPDAIRQLRIILGKPNIPGTILGDFDPCILSHGDMAEASGNAAIARQDQDPSLPDATGRANAGRRSPLAVPLASARSGGRGA